MTREQRKDWLEGIGVVAIIASLVLVGLETRNSTKQAVLTAETMEIAAYQEFWGQYHWKTSVEFRSMPRMRHTSRAR